jgi:16S rRNA (cytidine1402-2'-O)-methyltransferase
MAPLIVASTPIGNIGDASTRLRDEIATADLIAAEDSRKFHRLASDLSVSFSARVLSFFEGNESERVSTLMSELEAGKKVLLLTDAGTPGVSDPGYRLIQETIARGLPMSVIPGASAVLTALLYSGFPSATFAFDGFLPRTEASLERYLGRLINESRTTVVFESPRRVRQSLHAAVRILGSEREVAICREMTKTYEEIFRGSMSEAAAWADLREAGEGIKGEITLVFAPLVEEREYSDEEIVARVEELAESGYSTKDLAAIIALEFSIPKRRAYDLANSIKGAGS